jgi:hypothetical protein
LNEKLWEMWPVLAKRRGGAGRKKEKLAGTKERRAGDAMQSEVGVGKDDCRELEGGKARENRRCRAEGERGVRDERE